MSSEHKVNSIHFLELWIVSLTGSVRCMSIPVLGDKDPETIEELRKDLALKKGANIDGSSLGITKVENSDLALMCVPETARIIEFPSLPTCDIMRRGIPNRRIVVLGNLYSKLETGISQFDSRYMLQKAVDKYCKPDNYIIKIKTEPEFFLLDKEGKHPVDNAPYATVYPTNKGQDYLLDLSYELKKAEIPIKVLHHECGPAQVEIELNFTEVQKGADSMIIFKKLAQQLALAHGKTVTFMPKPLHNEAGSGLHIHFRLYKEDPVTKKRHNLFGIHEDPAKQSEVSETCQKFIQGIMNHVPAITAVANPSINSYKRLVPGFEAPTCIAWGYRNRSALCRVPSFDDPNNAAFEIRSPDSTCNIHMLLALLVSAGMEGIKQNVKPTEPVAKNLYEHVGAYKFLPENLHAALQEFSQDPFMKEVLGEKVVESYLKQKHAEWDDYLHGFISEWEREQYFDC